MTEVQKIQLERLSASFRSKSFNEHFAWYAERPPIGLGGAASAEEGKIRAMGCCAPEGRWYITNKQLQQVLDKDGRGLVGQVHDTYLIFYKLLS